ncbi:probable transcription factor At5g28040 [Triticum aestivum]|uniref:probable transcription factor At5g28040 n=1 Tax=Triticum aestivum TaxID=4565 RepID=UPI001D024BCF|nr:probable transcription factor At5g28040 [Triticum aestivum]
MASAAPSRSRSSSSADQDEEGTDSDASNDSPPPAAQQAPPPPFPDSSAPPPPAPAFTDPASAGAAPPPPPQGASAAEDSRRLFQRLWTDEEELLILRGFLEFTSRRGTAFASHQYDTGPFYEEIRRKLSFDFSKNQLIEKLRRLKKKYGNGYRCTPGCHSSPCGLPSCHYYNNGYHGYGVRAPPAPPLGYACYEEQSRGGGGECGIQ